MEYWLRPSPAFFNSDEFVDRWGMAYGLQEMAALLQRVMAGREEQKKQRQMDLERLLQRSVGAAIRFNRKAPRNIYKLVVRPSVQEYPRRTCSDVSFVRLPRPHS